MRHRKLIVRLLICLILLEPAARLYYAVAATPRAATFAASYRVHLDDAGYLAPDDFNSADLNISNGERRTVEQPALYEHTIWMYGNSILFGFNVSDDDTIPSQLQRLTNYRVVNRSAIGQALRGELAWLRSTPVRAGDIVIFGGSGDEAFAEQKAKPIPQWLRDECNRPAEQRTFVAALAVTCQMTALLQPDPVVYKFYMDDYAQTMQNVRQYVSQHGAIFLYLYDYPLPTAQDTHSDAYGHFNRHGASIVARTIFDAITVF